MSQATLVVNDASVQDAPRIVPENALWRYTEGAIESPEIALTHASSATFTPMHGPLSLGYCPGTLDILLTLSAPSPRKYWLQVSPTFLDNVSLYWMENGVLQALHAGDHIAASQRPVFSRQSLFPLAVTESSTYLLRISTTSTLSITPQLWQYDELLFAQQREDMLYGLLFGTTLTALVVAIICAIWTRLRLFWVIGTYLTSFGILHFMLNGFDQIYLYPQLGGIADNVLGAFTFIACLSILWFTQHYLAINTLYPRVSRVFSIVIILLAVGAIISALGYYAMLAKPLMLIGVAVISICMLLPFFTFSHRQTESILLLLTFFPTLIAIFMQTARNLGWLAPSFWTSHFWAMSSILQVLFILLVLLLRLSNNERSLQRERRYAQMLQDFYHLMAHELRTPLAIVSSAVSNIKLRTQTQMPDLAPRFSRVESALQRLNYMVDQSLFESRVQQQTALNHESLVDMNQLVREAVALTQVETTHQLRLDLSLSSLWVTGDAKMLTLAIINLLDNAVKYSAPGTSIFINSQCVSGHALLQIEDEGIGVPAEQQAQLFERYFRAANVSSETPGLGIGLYLVARTLELHGGTVSYEAMPCGSRFVIKLPLANEASSM